MKQKTSAMQIMKLRDNVQRFNEYANFFERDGNFKEGYDPYSDRETPFYKMFFDDRGYLTDASKKFLDEYVGWPGIKPMCDAVKMLVADAFAGNTHGNYPTVYLWR
jgi:hypothetical protein